MFPPGAVAGPLLAGLCGLALLASGWRPAPDERWLVLALALPLALSHAFAVDRGASFDSLVRVGGALLVFACARALSGPERLATLRLLALAGGVLALHGLWQFRFGFDRMLAAGGLDPALVARLETHRVFARFLLPSTLASFLLLALPTAAGFALARGARGRKVLAAAALACAGGLVLTQSQGAFLALVFAAAIWAMAAARLPVRRGAAILALAGLSVLAAVILVRGGVLFAGKEASGPAALRWRNWTAAVHMSADRPLTGVGGGGFGSAYTAYRQAGDNETRSAHNAYLQMIAEHGLPVLVPLVTVLIACAGWIRRAARASAPAAGAAFGLTAFLLHNLWDFSALLPSTLWTAAVIAGLLAPGHAPETGGRQPVLRYPRGRSRLLGLTEVAAVLLAILAGASVGVRSGLARAEREAAHHAALDGKRDTALARARRAERLAPWQAENAMLVAEVILAAPEIDAVGEARAAATRAVRRNRAWPAARRVRARALAASGDPGAAAAELHRAATLYPMSETYRRELDALGERLAARREGRQ